MNYYTLFAVPIVTVALVFYSIGIITEQRSRTVNRKILIFLVTGVILDITGTVFMILGSSRQGVTLHGLIGYSSLTLMTLDTILLWRFQHKSESNQEVPAGLHVFSRIAYTWWVLGYISGGLLVALR